MIPNKITAADIMNYEYCPRIVYFTRVLKLPQTKSAKQIKGLEKDFTFKKDTYRNKIIKRERYNSNLIRKYNISLETDEYATKIDCILINEELKEAYPLQMKYSRKPNKIYRTQKLQLMFEAMLIEKVLKHKVPYGYIKYALSNDLVKINLENRQILFETIEKVKNIIKNEIYPPATKYKKRLIDNCFRRIY
nr:CRISPR-associated exonuclease Cas4 [uncultured archaeon]